VGGLLDPARVSWATAHAGGTRLAVHVQPRAARTEVAGVHGDALKIRLAAPPVDGAANETLLRFLAAALDVPRTALSLAAGASGRRKRVLVATLPPEVVARRLLP
jgi:uncharacterized protein (TIGR00251 family)